MSDTLRADDAPPAAAPSCDCVAGALSAGGWQALLERAGFRDAKVAPSPDGTRALVQARRS